MAEQLEDPERELVKNLFENVIKKLIKILRNISDAQFKDKLTGKTFTLRKKLTPEEISIVEKLSMFAD